VVDHLLPIQINPRSCLPKMKSETSDLSGFPPDAFDRFSFPESF
jgi:hypothetical protein